MAIMGGSTCIARFSNNSIYPDKEKIRGFIQENNLDNVDLKAVKDLFDGKNLYCFINGHFIMFSVLKFVSSKLHKRNISATSLYDNAYNNCNSCRRKCRDYIELREKAQSLVQNYLNSID